MFQNKVKKTKEVKPFDKQSLKKYEINQIEQEEEACRQRWN